MGGRFIVRYPGEKELYMVLVGPFEYQFATTDIQQATQMPRSRAYAYADIWKGTALEV